METFAEKEDRIKTGRKRLTLVSALSIVIAGAVYFMMVQRPTLAQVNGSSSGMVQCSTQNAPPAY